MFANTKLMALYCGVLSLTEKERAQPLSNLLPFSFIAEKGIIN